MLISIICPVYNTEKYLNECIDSVLNQEFSNWELILVDDGSTDSSGKICDCFAAKDSRIKVFHKKNEGQAKAKFFGINKSNGQYIMFLDSDDYYANDTLNVISQEIKNSPSTEVFLFDGFKTHQKDLDCVYDYTAKSLFNNKADAIRFAFLQNITGYLPFTCIKKTTTIISNEIMLQQIAHLRYSEDFLYLFNIFLENVEKVTVIPRKIYFYRQHIKSITNSQNAAKLFDRFYSFETVYKTILENYGKHWLCSNLDKEIRKMIGWIPIAYIQRSFLETKRFDRKKMALVQTSIIYKLFSKKIKTRYIFLFKTFLKLRFYGLLGKLITSQ